MKKYLLIIALLVWADFAFSQGFSRNRDFIIGMGSGAAFYFGDLAADGDYSFIKPNLALSARYNFYDRYSVETQLTWFMLTGDDTKDPIKERRNLSFSSHNFELNLLGQVSLFPESFRFYQRPFANPYAYIGIGLVNFNPRAELNGEKYNLRKLETEGPENSYGLFTMSVPMGLGVKFRATPFLNINIDGGFRYVFTDYLDDVSSGEYPDPASFDSEAARLLSDRTWEVLPPDQPTYAERGLDVRGNPSKNDAYLILNLRVEYFFGNLNLGGGYKPAKGRKPKPYRPRNIRRR